MCPSSGGGAGAEKHLVLPRFHQQDTECEMWMKHKVAEEEDKEEEEEEAREELKRSALFVLQLVEIHLSIPLPPVILLFSVSLCAPAKSCW